MKLNTLEIGGARNETSPFVVNRIWSFPGTKKYIIFRPTRAAMVTVHTTVNISPSLHTCLWVPSSWRTAFHLFFILRFYKYGLTDSLEVCSNPNCIQHIQRGARRGNLVTQNSRKPFSGQGSEPDPWRSLQHSPSPASWSHPRSWPFGPRALALWASSLLFLTPKVCPLSAPTWFRLATPLHDQRLPNTVINQICI